MIDSHGRSDSDANGPLYTSADVVVVRPPM
jgi:hypothetical protein